MDVFRCCGGGFDGLQGYVCVLPAFFLCLFRYISVSMEFVDELDIFGFVVLFVVTSENSRCSGER